MVDENDQTAGTDTADAPAAADTAPAMTADQANALEAQLRTFRNQQAAAAAATRRDAAKSLLDFVASDAFKQAEAAITDLDKLSTDAATFPNIRIHIDALRYGLAGLRQMAGTFIVPDPVDVTATA